MLHQHHHHHHHPHHHPHMHELSQQHAFTPILQQPAGTQDRNVNSTLHGRQVSSVTAFHRTTQKSSSTEQVRGRWAALHVCIAWKIFYHKQLESLQENPTCEGPSSSGRRSQQAYTHPYLQSQCGRLLYGDFDDRSEVGKAPSSVSRHRRHPPRPHTPPTRREIHEVWPGADAFRHRRPNPELDVGRRKRPLECEGLEKVKRAERQDFHPHPSHFDATRSYMSSHGVQVQHVRDLPAEYPNGGGYDVSYPGELRHYEAAPWLQLRARLNIPDDASVGTCKASRTHLVTERQRKEAFFMSPVCFPVALTSQSPLQGSASSRWPSGIIQSRALLSDSRYTTLKKT